MKNFLPEVFGNPPSTFVDRTEIRNIIMDECEHKMQKDGYFKVIAIYGIGGIGKTKLIEKIKETIIESPYKRKVIHISFEINKNRECLDNIIKIRKTFSKSCSIFDYALLNYWDNNRTERLNSDFMDTIKSGFLPSFFDTMVEITESVMPFACPLAPGVSIPSISGIFDCVNKLIPKIKNANYQHILSTIPGLASQELLDMLPLYLGIDIQRQMKKSPEIPMVFIFDSYQQSQPYAESQEWLYKLIGTIRQGLFLITGREALHWADPDNEFNTYPLKAFPEEVARDLLKSYISETEKELIDTIIESTECVPIYVDLAIKVYKSEVIKNPQSLIKKSLFTDRNLLVRQFINHMPPNWQEVLIDLSVIRVFNQDIFDYLVKSQNLPCTFIDYEEIIQTSLIDYIENSDQLSKIHDVFCKNSSKILSKNIKLKIFKSYLTYLSERAVHQDSLFSNASMVTLFLNVLSLEDSLSQEGKLEVHIWELTLDMFFYLYDMKMIFTPPAPSPSHTDDYNDMLYLISSINHKSISTLQTVELFKSIKNPRIFGKHEYSFLLLYKYAVSLLGNYEEWYVLLKSINMKLTESDLGTWYDTRTKLYLADYGIMDGTFIQAHTALLKMKDYIANNYMTKDDTLLVFRYVGHLFRFNLFCEKAACEYQTIFEKMPDTVSLNVYIKTNLCETNCYFEPDYLKDNFEETLALAVQLKHIKNIGKLYYSRGIARTVMGDFSGAQDDINQSLQINRKDGYQSGELFAYMAQAYLDYAVDGFVHQKSESKILELISKNRVYRYFSLPLLIMAGDNRKISSMRKEYEWLDFDFTISQYQKFFYSIRKEELYH